MARKKAVARKHRVDRTPSKVYSDAVDWSEVKRMRESMGLTQLEAAQAAGWKTQQQWANVESGKRPDPRLSTVLAMTKVLGCEVVDLLRKR